VTGSLQEKKNVIVHKVSRNIYFCFGAEFFDMTRSENCWVFFSVKAEGIFPPFSKPFPAHYTALEAWNGVQTMPQINHRLINFACLSI